MGEAISQSCKDCGSVVGNHSVILLCKMPGECSVGYRRRTRPADRYLPPDPARVARPARVYEHLVS